jgi:hypothetical protein
MARKPKAETGAREVPAPVPSATVAEPVVLAEPGVPPEPPAPPPPVAEPVPTILRVTGPRQGRWRSGPTLAARFYTADPIDHLIADLSLEDIAALEADPVLNVERIIPET